MLVSLISTALVKKKKFLNFTNWYLPSRKHQKSLGGPGGDSLKTEEEQEVDRHYEHEAVATSSQAKQEVTSQNDELPTESRQRSDFRVWTF